LFVASSGLHFRHDLVAADVDEVERLVRSTGFFSEEEIAIARELAELGLTEQGRVDYQFVLALAPEDAAAGRLVGYSCYGPIPATASSYDLYWIVVDGAHKHQGIGRSLLQETERALRARGASKFYADTSSRPQYEPTHAFYLGTGFTKEAFLKDFYAPGDGKLIFTKNLVPSR
jgi:ribosomal protein S18 acetylase RimI-like enzyme